MTEETSEIEPPDLDPRGLTYYMNGKGSPRKLFRFAEASNGEQTYLLKIGAITVNPGEKIIFEYNEKNDNYTCIGCNSKAIELPTSRTIWGDSKINKETISCTRGPYCPKCEIYPKNGRLPPINERDLETFVTSYEEFEKKGIQQTI